MTTALSNRIGDIALLIVIAWILNFGRWNYIFYLDCMKSSYETTVIRFLVVLTTKRAQIPFSSWLPAKIWIELQKTFIYKMKTSKVRIKGNCFNDGVIHVSPENKNMHLTIFNNESLPIIKKMGYNNKEK